MEKSQVRHLFYFSDEPLLFIEELLEAKRLSFTRIDPTDFDGALACARRLSQAVLSNPNSTQDSISYLCLGQSCGLALSLQQQGNSKILLINPITQEFFGKIPIITGQSQQELILKIKEYLENSN